MVSDSSSHQCLATAARTSSGAANASHTFVSGKFNELISLLIRDANAPSGGSDQGPITAETAAWPRCVDFFNRTLDCCQNELTRRTTSPGGGFTETTVKAAR